VLVGQYGLFSYRTNLPGAATVNHEIALAMRGRQLGTALNRALPRPLASVGVSAAGGVGLTYRGRIVDEMGLNWVAMAHASLRRSGVRGHSAFDADQFWRTPPDVMAPCLCPAPPYHVSPWLRVIYKGLLDQQRFRDTYQPATYDTENGTLFLFASRRFLAILPPQNAPRLLPWSSILTESGSDAREKKGLLF
jgi:hypothetical protein